MDHSGEFFLYQISIFLSHHGQSTYLNLFKKSPFHLPFWLSLKLLIIVCRGKKSIFSTVQVVLNRDFGRDLRNVTKSFASTIVLAMVFFVLRYVTFHSILLHYNIIKHTLSFIILYSLYYIILYIIFYYIKHGHILPKIAKIISWEENQIAERPNSDGREISNEFDMLWSDMICYAMLC